MNDIENKFFEKNFYDTLFNFTTFVYNSPWANVLDRWT